MIQRIQTLYLFIVAILMGSVCLLPLAEFIWGGEVFKLYAWGIRSAEGEAETIVNVFYMGILCAISAILPLITIFLYKKRWAQIRLCVVEMILIVGVIIYTSLYLYRTYSSLENGGAANLVFSITDILPLVALFLTFLAFRAIIKDEALVRSLNRIR